MAFLEQLKTRLDAPRLAPGEPAFEQSAAPKLKARFTDLADLIAPNRRARILAARQAPEATPPDPAKILFPDNDAASGGQYDDIARALLNEARGLDTIESANADQIGRGLVGAIIDRSTARAIGAMAFMVQAALGIGFFGMFLGLFYRIASDANPGVFGYGALYLALGAITAALVVFFADGATAGAGRRFNHHARNLVDLVTLATRDFSDRLVELRSAMAANSAGDFPDAIKAATQARLLTVSAVRFFQRAPVIGAESEGARCEILVRELQGGAFAGLKAVIGGLFVFFGALAAFGAGAAALYYSATPRPDLMMVPEIVSRLNMLEAAYPGRVSIPLAIAGAILAPVFLGPLIALASASANPRALLGNEPVRSLVNGLQARALSASAERQREMIERYADALLSLEKRARGWAAKGGAGFDSASEDDTPAWRRPPEGPRFVETGFQAAPKSFRADPKSGRLTGRDEKNINPKTAPKRGLFSLKNPAGS